MFRCKQQKNVPFTVVPIYSFFFFSFFVFSSFSRARVFFSSPSASHIEQAGLECLAQGLLDSYHYHYDYNCSFLRREATSQFLCLFSLLPSLLGKESARARAHARLNYSCCLQCKKASIHASTSFDGENQWQYECSLSVLRTRDTEKNQS